MSSSSRSGFVNPYTFIPLKRRSGVFVSVDERRVSGIISCRMTVKTPLIIPSRKVQAGDPTAENACFRIDGKPAVPGSSIRGPIRSMYEAVTNSCMRLNDDSLSSPGGHKIPGLLTYDPESGEYWLYKAKRYRVTAAPCTVNPSTKASWVTGDKVYFTWEPKARRDFATADGVVQTVSDRPSPNTNEGYYLRVNQMDGKTANTPSVFVMGAKVAQPIGKEFVCSLEENIGMYVENHPDSVYARHYEQCFSRMRAGGVLPVWYSYEKVSDGTYAFHFAWAQLSRNVYPKKIGEFVRSLGLQQCTGQDGNVCPACDLFGFVAGREGNSRAGKVRFGDALPSGEVKTEYVILPPLLEPRPQAIEFYFKNPNHPHTFTPMTDGTVLAGRKMYWHSQSGLQQRGPIDWNDEKNRFAARAEAVAEGSVFNFKVYFDEVSVQQLNELVYVLSLGQVWNPEDSTHWHKIGHGKPVGAGSVLIEVSSVLVRDCDGTSYRLSSWDEYRLPVAGVEGKAGTVEWRLSNTAEMLKVTDSCAIDAEEDIDYPRTYRGGDIFDWFKDNRKTAETAHGVIKSDATTAGFKVLLPEVGATSQVMERHLKDKRVVLESTDHPAVVGEVEASAPKQGMDQIKTGSIDSFREPRPGKWSGWIKQDDGRPNIYFSLGENPHLDPSGIRRGLRVTYETIDTEHRGKPAQHAVNVELGQ